MFDSKIRLNFIGFVFVFCFLFCNQLSGQSNIVAELDFDPKKDGFSFKNYRNEGELWKNDLLSEDVIRMFGFETSCKAGDKAQNCVLHPSARQWMDEMLEAMDIGHCEGIAVASLRLKTGIPFKSKLKPEHFQNNARTPFSLTRDQTLENYIAYYWITQTFDEVKRKTAQTAAGGPVKIAQTLIASMKAKSDTFLLSFSKYDPKTNRESDPHAVLPFAVAETEDRYILHIYDNNYPGETRYLYIKKAGLQVWEYNSKADPKAKPDYVGDRSTQTLSITATSWREGRCFESKWRKGVEKAGCGIAELPSRNDFFKNVSYQTPNPPFRQSAETAEFFLTDEGDMLVTDPNGDRIGYDPKTDYFYENEIPNSIADSLIGGFFEDVPHYTVPFIDDEDAAYQVLFSGKYLDAESDLDFVYSAPYFTVGFSGIRLDPKETLETTISTDGEQIVFKASADSETPEVFFAFDSEEDDGASYFAYIEGVELSAGKTLIYDFDFDNGKLLFSDDDGNEDMYDIKLIRVNADGSVQIYEQEDLDIGKTDRYEMDFGDWDGEGDMCFKDDDDGDGEFEDEECTELDNEEEEEN